MQISMGKVLWALLIMVSIVGGVSIGADYHRTSGAWPGSAGTDVRVANGTATPAPTPSATKGSTIRTVPQPSASPAIIPSATVLTSPSPGGTGQPTASIQPEPSESVAPSPSGEPGTVIEPSTPPGGGEENPVPGDIVVTIDPTTIVGLP